MPFAAVNNEERPSQEVGTLLFLDSSTNKSSFFLFLKVLFSYFFREGEGREKERERNINV